MSIFMLQRQQKTDANKHIVKYIMRTRFVNKFRKKKRNKGLVVYV